MQFIQVRNFEKFQHYKDRRPPWIKLYRDLLSDDRLFDLSEADRYQLVGLFILASQHDNMIPNKEKWLRKELAITRPISLKNLIASGWIELMEQDASGALSASTGLAEGKQEARVETEKRRDREETEIYIAHGEFGWCLLTSEQERKLQIKLGDLALAYINRFDRWLEENPKLRKTRHAYPSILNWFDKDGGSKPNGGNRNAHRETHNEKDNRAVQDFINRSLAPEMQPDLSDVWQEP